MPLNSIDSKIILSLQQCDITFSRNEAARIVGGLKKLYYLVDTGRVRAVKPNTTAQNGRWRCQAIDVLLYARPKKEKSWWEKKGIKPPRMCQYD